MNEENLYTFENPEYRKTFWHTSSHVMAQAVKRLWPEVQLAIGPAIDEGWYYDFDDLLHLGFDLGQVLGGEGEGCVKVVVPALVDGGADGKLDFGPQTLDGLGHHMGAGVPEGLAVFGVFKGVQIFFGHDFFLLLNWAPLTGELARRKP